MALKITRAGFLASVQGAERTGFRHAGVSSGGALDLYGMRVANVLAGNSETAAGLEITSGTFRCRVARSRVVAWIGGSYRVTVHGRSIPAGRPALLGEGEELSITGPTRGCRAWLAVSGGIDVPVVLGSRSTDLRAGFGGWQGRALQDGDELPLGGNPPPAEQLIRSLVHARMAPWSAPFVWSSPAEGAPHLRVLRGRDWDQFEAGSQHSFCSGEFVVAQDADRMGARLEGALLRRLHETDLVSEAVAPGTVQVPPGGLPILLLGDCQTNGGYPKLAHVITVDLARAAQLGPGASIRFREVLLPEAHQLLWQREQDFAKFKIGLSMHP